MPDIKKIRAEAGINQITAASWAGVSQNTWRLYENNPAALRLDKRLACDRTFARIEQLADRKRAA